MLHGVGCDIIWELVSSDVELISSEIDLTTHFQLNAFSRCIDICASVAVFLDVT